MTLELVEIPDYALVHDAAFMDWFIYNAPWRLLPALGLESCPICATAIFGDWIEKQRHGLYHIQLLRRLPADG